MQPSQPAFSVVTVTYNDLPGLKHTSESVAQQTFHHFEWVIVDGASTDGTVAFLQGLSLPFACWSSEPDKGIYDAMNKGMLKARGEYVVFLNAGDAFPSPDTLAAVNDFVHAQSKPADIIFGGAQLVLPHGGTIYRAPRDMGKYIWHGLPANHQATYFRRAWLESLQYDTHYKICGDYYLVARFFNNSAQAAYLDKPLVNFRVGDTSYRNPVRLFMEPYAIQKNVLRLPLRLRLLSLLRRLYSTLGLVVLSQKWVGAFVRRSPENSRR